MEPMLARLVRELAERTPAKFVRWRPDRAPESCRLDQLAPPPIAIDVLRA
jgi:hypothetical protein